MAENKKQRRWPEPNTENCMCALGKEMKRRYWNFFRKDGKTLILALDHGGGGDFPIDNPGEVIEEAVEAGVDGVLTTYGIIKNYRKEIGKAGLMLRMDAYGSALNVECFEEEPAGKWNLEDALNLGIDGAMCFGFIGRGIKNGVNYDTLTLRLLAKIAEECDKYGLVSGAEMLPGGFSSDPADRTQDKMRIACRCAAESGIDIVKTEFVPPVEEYKKVVDNCYVPVIALGGSNKGNREFFIQCKAALDAGCKGLAIGRNIWGASDVGGTVRALVKLVHENASVDEAMKEME